MEGVSPSQAQIQEQARRAGVVRSLHHLISRLQSTLLGLAAGVAFKLCLFGGEPCRPPLHWLALLGCGVSSALTSPFPIWTAGHVSSPCELQPWLRHCDSANPGNSWSRTIS